MPLSDEINVDRIAEQCFFMLVVVLKIGSVVSTQGVGVVVGARVGVGACVVVSSGVGFV